MNFGLYPCEAKRRFWDLYDAYGVPTSGQFLTWNATTKRFELTTPVDTDEKVKASASGTAGYLDAIVDAVTLEIAANVLRIKDAGVSYAKIQNVSADKLLGSIAGGAPEEIACTAAGRALLDDANAAAQATTLGLGTADSVTHANLILSGQLQRFKSKVQAKTADYTITTDESGTIFTNDGAGGAVVLTLPAAAAGLRYTFITVTSASFKALRAGTDVIYYDGTNTYTYAEKALLGHSLTLVCTKTGVWSVESIGGTWTFTT
jgi:hypothetical protein